MNIKELAKYIKDIVDPNKMSDNSHNDIQVENTGEIAKIAVAVDACIETIDSAAKIGAQALIVHHGLLWGGQLPIATEENCNYYNRVKALIQNNIALLAYHLPLDAHPEFGNNIILANKLGLINIKPFGRNFNDNSYIGFKGKFEKAKDIGEVLDLLDISALDVKFLPFGTHKIKSIGIVSGGGAYNLQDAINENLDLFVTGEVKHSTYHQAKEGNINVLAAGHYFTETFGTKALGEKIQKETGIECVFIDCPTGF